MLAVPNFSTLALYTYRLAGAFRFNQACACAMVMILVGVVPFVIARKRDVIARKPNVIASEARQSKREDACL